ncbi:hypothetical protein ABFS82_13G148200 [Erythranthe guttata]|nr:PREDICTED: transcription factor JUNGBRUNNEN 1-like [Erythranthe guttata]|eukprot:XP_012848637.1 PREDICTED: transcription factor JUNGBRUNNEN 1-like [Erythranthe guttata]
MEVENISSIKISNKEEDDVPLPGFRFHPTDEELVSFYLRRKVEKKPLRIELIKQADIYQYDPWDLPKSSNGGEKEWYFFCRRGRKYKNSIRPNRVTASGFWKATGIDKPIYSSCGSHVCIGLKKSLVYYRGSAGKGTKTEWMMHEFRLPPKTATKHTMDSASSQEAEVWTLCRILKRNVGYRKCVAADDWRMSADGKRNNNTNTNNNNNNIMINPVLFDASSKTCSVESCDQNGKSGYICFNAPLIPKHQINDYDYNQDKLYSAGQDFGGHLMMRSSLDNVLSADNHDPNNSDAASSFSSYTNYGDDINEFLRRDDWEDLRSIVDYAAANPLYMSTN